MHAQESPLFPPPYLCALLSPMIAFPGSAQYLPWYNAAVAV